jgi:hypothetical protein
MVKAADIPDVELLAAIAEVTRRRTDASGAPWGLGANRWDIGWVLSGYEGLAQFTDPAPEMRYPEKVVLAKARSLVRRGLLLGCPCGCRGDFEVPA